jgi:ribose transport system permease protein
VLTGINLGITKANPFYNLPSSFRAIGSMKIVGVPLLLFLMLALAIALALMFRYLGLGRQILALGGNITAAELSGVPINKVVIASHVLCGVLAAVAAILLTSRLGSAQPDVGKDWLLPSFAAPIIGGTRLAGGKVSVVVAVLGAILLALISNGLVFLNIDVYWNQFIQGIIILSAVGLDRVRTISAERLERHQT